MVVDMNSFELTDMMHPVWAKIPAISRAFSTYPSTGWVWWLDVDAIIMTPHIDLYDHLLKPTSMKKLLLEGELIKVNDKVPIQRKGPVMTGKVF
jgi:galactosyl transferase GMA12/MNN10 family